MFGINPKEYQIKVEISKCFNNIASVYVTKYIPTGESIALKRYRMDKAVNDEYKLIASEILAMRQFNHPNIFSFYTAFIFNFDVYLIAPLTTFGSCKDAISNYFFTGFPEILVCLILRDVVLALEYLHRKGFIHRSIRASHILLCETKAILSGFRESTSYLTRDGCYKTLHNLAPCSVKSLNWLSPEVLEQNLLGYTEKSDIYSLGITTCELANGVEPFANMKTTFMFTEKIRGNQPTLLDNSTCPTEEMIAQASGDTGDYLAQTRQIYNHRTFSDSFHKFAEICMERYPIDRPSAFQLLNHAFFKQIKGVYLYQQLMLYGIGPIDCGKFKDEYLLSDKLANINLDEENFNWDF